ncbi:integumentary mucin C.1-like [Labeo rohita]|uniref:integumentary mucin C.1-like n=1 Tax=Labeo rohita TaxID=84645 RepID=UPI0021E2F75C|nr:integumentary mucin C.1-like [Labeo rohita]
MRSFLVSQHLLVILSVVSLTRAQTIFAPTTTEGATTTPVPTTAASETTTETTTVTPETTTRVETSTTGITTTPDPTTLIATTTSTTITTTVPSTPSTVTSLAETVIGVQMKFNSFSDLTQSGNIEDTLRQIRQELINRGVSSNFELKLRKVKKTQW